MTGPSSLLAEGSNSTATIIVNSASCSGARLVQFGRTNNFAAILENHPAEIGVCIIEDRLEGIATACRHK